jgi:hypothetical protein
MAEWKKVIVSGSSAELNNIFAKGAITGSHISSSGDLFASLVTASTTNVVTYNTTTGKFHYTASTNVGTNTIGTPSDTTYEGGLFPFTSGTLIADAVDDINEILASLVPAEAPALQSLGDTETSGWTPVFLAFGSSNTISGVTNVDALDTLAALNVSGTYGSTPLQSGSTSYRLGINNNTSYQTVTGRLNLTVAQNGGTAGTALNYPATAFGDANVGKLYLYLNRTDSQSLEIDLESTPAAITVSNTSASITVSQTASAFFAGGSPYTGFINRTGSFTIEIAHQREGMNFIRIIHTSSTFERATKYIQWINDISNQSSTVTSTVGSFTGTGLKYNSGVKYFTGGHVEWRASVSNIYNRVYSLSPTAIIIEIDGPTNFFEVNTLYQSGSTTRTKTGGNGSTLSDYITSASQITDTHLFPLILTASVSGGALVSNTYSLIVDNDDISKDLVIQTDILRTPRTTLSNQGQQSIKGLLMDNRAILQLETNQSESFVSESYRLVPAAYDTQASVISAIGGWDSSQTIADGGAANYNKGLLVMPYWADGGQESNSNGMLVYPSGSTTYLPQGGDFSIFNNGPSSNVNYSTGVTGYRTYYRAFKNESGGAPQSFNIILATHAGIITVLPTGSTLGGGNIYLEIKDPGATAWLDLGATLPQNASEDLTVNGASGRSGTLSPITTSNTTITALMGNLATNNTIANNDYVVIKITANAGFTGSLKTINIPSF